MIVRNPPRLFSTRGNLALVLAILLFLFACLGGGVLWNGKKSEEAANKKIEEGLGLLESQKAEEAITSFQSAKKGLGFSYKIYRGIGASKLSLSDLNQLIVSAALMVAYDRFFSLTPQPELLEQAEEALAGVSGQEGRDMKALVRTAKTVSALCAMTGEKKFAEVMKKLLEAEKEAMSDDRDFFILEIRLLIACGKGLQSKAILGQARELLWFITSEAGVKGPRIDRLWRLLSQ